MQTMHQFSLFTFYVNSLKFSSLWWVKAHGLKYCQIPRGSASVSSCHSFPTTRLQSRTAPSATYLTTKILILEIPFILHKSYSEVITACIYQSTQNYIMLTAFLKHFLIITLIISNQMVTSILRWSNTDNCVPSPRGSDSCTPFSSITTDCWNRSLSQERYFCKKLKYIAPCPPPPLSAAALNVSPCCRSCWSMQFIMVWTLHRKESYRTKLMLKCGSQGSEEDWVAY